MKVSVIIASCYRSEMFREMLVSLRSTIDKHDVEIIAVVDDDYKTAQTAIDFDLDVLDYSRKRRGALDAWNIGLFHSDGDIIVPAGDDQIFHPGWLEYALESHQERLGGSGVVGMNDLAYNGNLQVATMFLFDRQYCKDYMGGVLCPPVYKYYCIDLEWNEKAKQAGKFYWDERSKVEHLHSAHSKRPYDLHDKEKEDAGWMAQDNKIYEERKSRGFPIVWDSLI